MTFIKRLFLKWHQHKWIKITEIPKYEYWDYSGFHVGVFECECLKCGKTKMRKYY